MCVSPLLVAIVVSSVAADGPWLPPENPDPSAILKEAQADTRTGNYEQALAKHVWYHENALTYQPAQSGVRLSFALMYWKQLADAYPAALFKLMEIREKAIFDVLGGANARAAFQELTAINRTLKEEQRTVETFVSLHEKNASAAKQVYPLAQPALIKAKEYKLCGSYVDPDQFRITTATYQATKRMAKDAKLGDFANNKFSNDATTLVALLVVNDRTSEAAKVAAAAKQEWDDKGFHKAIDEALKGKVPDPWP